MYLASLLGKSVGQMGPTGFLSLSSEPLTDANLLPWPGMQWMKGKEQIWTIQIHS